MKLPFLSKLGSIRSKLGSVTGVFSRLNPKALLAKVNFGALVAKIKRKKSDADDRDEDDFRPSSGDGDEEDFLGDLGDLDALDAEIKAAEEEREEDDQDDDQGDDQDDDKDDLSVDEEDASEDLSTEDQVLADLEAMPDFDEGTSDDDDEEEEDVAAARAKMKKMAIFAGGGVVVAILIGGVSWLLIGGADTPKMAQDTAVAGQTVFSLEGLPLPPRKKAPPKPRASSAIPATKKSESTSNPTAKPQSTKGVLSGGQALSSSGLGGELALLGLDRIQQPGAGIVIPSSTSESFSGLEPWPPSKALKVAPVAELVKLTDIGPLPMVSAEGLTSVKAYKRPVPPGDTAKPIVAIVVTGLGVSRASTEAAISGLSSDVTFALDVYARGLDYWVSKMRQNGHEILLQLPMESASFPFDDPGPQSLLALASPTENIQKLEFVLSRTTGYFGVIGFYGGKFLTVQEQVKNILMQLKKRGLMYVDNGVKGSLGVDVAKNEDMQWAQINVNLDAVEGRSALLRQFSELENLALKHSIATAKISATPLNLRTLSLWLKQLDAKGLRLAPISSISKKQTAQ